MLRIRWLGGDYVPIFADATKEGDTRQHDLQHDANGAKGETQSASIAGNVTREVLHAGFEGVLGSTSSLARPT